MPIALGAAAAADAILSFFQYDSMTLVLHTAGSELKMVLLLDFKVRYGMNIFYTDLCQDLVFLPFSALNQKSERVLKYDTPA